MKYVENEMMKKLNELTKISFINNYDKSEVQRILLSDTEEIKTIKKEIKDLFDKACCDEDITINISDSYIEICRITERTETSTSMQVLQKIFSDNFEKLPTSYVMGKKISKKLFNETLKNLI